MLPWILCNIVKCREKKQRRCECFWGRWKMNSIDIGWQWDRDTRMFELVQTRIGKLLLWMADGQNRFSNSNRLFDTSHFGSGWFVEIKIEHSKTEIIRAFDFKDISQYLYLFYSHYDESIHKSFVQSWILLRIVLVYFRLQLIAMSFDSQTIFRMHIPHQHPIARNYYTRFCVTHTAHHI